MNALYLGKITRWVPVVLLAAALTGCGTTGGSTTGGSVSKGVIDENSTDPAVMQAVALYKRDCLVCHGPQFEGKMPRAAMKNVGSKLNADQIRDKILNGSGGMIAYKNRLSEEEVTLLTDWLASKK